MALAAVRSKAVVLLLLIRCWLLPPLWDSVIVLGFGVRNFVPILVLQSRAGCFALFLYLVSHDCCVALPHDATDLSTVCDCGIPDHTHYFFIDSFTSLSEET